MNNHTTERGFVALMSAVIISIVLVMLVMTVGMSSLFARMDSLGGESKVGSRLLAESCINVALLALATSTDALHYTATNQSIIVGHDVRGAALNCVIETITHTGSSVTINTHASSNTSFSTVSTTVSLQPTIHITSYRVQ